MLARSTLLVKPTSIRSSVSFVQSMSMSSDKKNKGAPKGKSEFADLQQELDNLTKFYETVSELRWKVPEFTPEEREAHHKIGHEYNRQTTRALNTLEFDLSNKSWMQNDAIKALPEPYKSAAIKEYTVPIPQNRPFPTFDTPPIKDFDPTKYLL